MKEKYNLIQELKAKSDELTGKKRLSLIGQGDFSGANNVMRGTMNIKHHTQHLAIQDPEFPFIYDGKENVAGEHSSFFIRADKEWQVYAVCKKYNELLKGKCYVGLYFLYNKKDNEFTVVERQEVENLTENFGFDYNNDFLDNTEKGDIIAPGTILKSSKSYDEFGNVSIGVNGRILYAVHPAVQDDAIIVSESFAKRMVCSNVTSKTVPIGENTLLLNLYGKDGNYQGLPNIGDIVTNGIICATRTIREARMFSDLRDHALSNINMQTDSVIYGDGEIIDINIYCNNNHLKLDKVNAQLIQYMNDAKWFYTEVYRVCKDITRNHADAKIDKEINRWMRKAMNHLDTQAQWAFNDNNFSNMMVEILIRKKDPIKVGRKIVG